MWCPVHLGAAGTGTKLVSFDEVISRRGESATNLGRPLSGRKMLLG